MAPDYANTGPANPSILQLLMERVGRIAPVIRSYAATNERERRLARPVTEALINAGLFQMWTPQLYGGLEVDPISLIRVVEEVARLDSAAAWNLQLANGLVPLLAWIPDDGVEEICADHPDLILGGTLFPPGSAVPVDGGYRVSGRWPFVSGCHDASWFLGPVLVMEDNIPRRDADGNTLQLLIVYRAEEAEILDTWYTVGMRGTGSHDVVLKDVFVPARRTALLQPLTRPAKAFSGPLYRLTIWSSISVLAAPALGIARAAIDALIALGNKVPSFAHGPLRERSSLQSQVSEAEALIGAGRAYLFEALRESWNSALRGDMMTIRQKTQIQLATSFAVQAAANAVDLVHRAAGTTAIRIEETFQQHFRDVHVITQHAFASTSRYESVGKVLFGLDTDWPFFAL